MKKILALVLITATLLAILVGCGSSDDNTPEPTATTYITLRINPEIELTADENGKIISTNSLNEDGDIVLSSVDLIGMDASDAAEAFTNASVELGYINIDNAETTVYADVQSDDPETKAKIEKSMTEKIHGYFDNNGIYGKVSPETLDKYLESAAEWGISAGHVKMVMRLLDLYPEMSEEEALSMSVSEYRKAIHKAAHADEKVTSSLMHERKAKIEALKEKYASAFALSDRIEELEKLLNDETLSEEERATLSAEYEDISERYANDTEAYRSEVEKIKEDYKKLSKDKHGEYKNKAENAKKQNIDKLNKHREKINANLPETIEAIRAWRAASN